MKLATYQLDGKQRFGAIFGNNIAELSGRTKSLSCRGGRLIRNRAANKAGYF